MKLLMLALLLLAGCRKECMNRSLKELHCKDGYISVSDTRYIHHRSAFSYQENEVVIINDTITYKDLFQNKLSQDYVDFTYQSVVAVKIPVGAGSTVDSQGCLCFDPLKNKWLFNIEYTIYNQCKGSGIYTMNFTSVIICPKLPDNTFIEFNARDINPF